MRRFPTVLARTLALVATAVALAIGAFELAVVQPALAKMRPILASALPSERNAPVALAQVLDRTEPELVKYHLARNLLATPPSQIEGIGTTRRQFTELTLGLALQAHLSAQEQSALFLSQAYMGPGIKGFGQAAQAYLGVPLEQVTRSQAARLVAISQAPSLYLASPERLARRTELILASERQ